MYATSCLAKCSHAQALHPTLHEHHPWEPQHSMHIVTAGREIESSDNWQGHMTSLLTCTALAWIQEISRELHRPMNPFPCRP